MDLTGGESQDWMKRGYIEAASTDGDGVAITGDPGNLPDDVDEILSDLLADHDVGRYPGGAVVGWFSSGDLTGAAVRDPAEVESEPYPFETG